MSIAYVADASGSGANARISQKFEEALKIDIFSMTSSFGGGVAKVKLFSARDDDR